MSHAFTLKGNNGLLQQLITSCHVAPPLRLQGPNIVIPSPEKVGKEFKALWDTGASGTVITKNVVDALGLKPHRTVKVYHANGENIVPVYWVNIYLPNRVAMPVIEVTEGVLTGFDILIGMNIILQGDFSITNVNKTTVFSFRIPSEQEIDYVKEADAKANSLTVNSDTDPQPVMKVGRNDPCPCGSGKKYKSCHGRN